MKEVSTGRLRLHPSTHDEWEGRITLVDDDGMPLVWDEALKPFHGKIVTVTVELVDPQPEPWCDISHWDKEREQMLATKWNDWKSK